MRECTNYNPGALRTLDADTRQPQVSKIRQYRMTTSQASSFLLKFVKTRNSLVLMHMQGFHEGKYPGIELLHKCPHTSMF